MSRKEVLVSFVLVAAMSACTKQPPGNTGTPKEVLARYIESAFAVKSRSGLGDLKKYLAGDAAREIDNLQDVDTDSKEARAEKESEFQKRFVDQKYKPGSLKIRDERKTGEDSFSITYELSYQVSSGEEKVAVAPPVLPNDEKKYPNVPDNSNGGEQVKQAAEDAVITKKNAIFIKDEKGNWVISEVQNLKTVVERKTEDKIVGVLKNKDAGDAKSGAAQ